MIKRQMWRAYSVEKLEEILNFNNIILDDIEVIGIDEGQFISFILFIIIIY